MVLNKSYDFGFENDNINSIEKCQIKAVILCSLNNSLSPSVEDAGFKEIVRLYLALSITSTSLSIGKWPLGPTLAWGAREGGIPEHLMKSGLAKIKLLIRIKKVCNNLFVQKIQPELFRNRIKKLTPLPPSPNYFGTQLLKWCISLS